MKRSRIQYSSLFSYLSAPALAVLSFSSMGLAQVIPNASIQTVDVAQAQPVSTEATDLVGEAIAPTIPSATTPNTSSSFISSESLTTTIAAISVPERSQLEILDESLPILKPAPVASPLPVFFSSSTLPVLNTAPSEIRAQTSTPTDSELPAESLTSRIADNSYDPNANLRIPPNLAEGKPIQQVYIYLRNPTGDSDRDAQVQQEIADAFGNQAGGSFSPRFADLGVNQVRQLPFIEVAEYRVYESDLPGSVIVAVLVTLTPAGTPSPPQVQESTGILATGNADDFPVLYESDRTLVRMIWNGSLGLFSDTNPWFGNSENFLAGPYFPRGTVTWPEFNLETGIGGITQLGDAPFYLYGAATYTISASLAPDIFRPDSRAYGAVEQLYGGALVAAPGSPLSFNLSAGRQRFQLNQGFLFSQFAGAVNALERGGSYLNPRTAYDMTVLANLRFGDFRLQGFFLEPNELPIADTGTEYLGASLSYNNNRNVEASLSYITVPHSDTLYFLPNGETATRQGLQVINPQIRLSSLFGVDGLWAAGEYAYEFSDELDMSAHGGYIWLGYTAQDVSWRPSISYRFAGFSGDDPDTSTYERFDPLQAGGLSDWLQGISLGKVYNNSNGFSHRVSLSVQPSSALSISLDYYYRYADELNNLGGSRPLQILQSRDIGHEVQLVTRYFITQNFMLQGLAGIAFPGAAIRRAVSEDTDPWVTVQLSLFMFF